MSEKEFQALFDGDLDGLNTLLRDHSPIDMDALASEDDRAM